MHSNNTRDVCTTQEAARLLNLSVTSVQQLVESGVLKAWKTKGGHRRIPLSAVEAYKASMMREAPSVRLLDGRGITRIVVIEDNEMQRAVYENRFASWGLPLEVRFCSNGYQALVEISALRPDVLLADIVMNGIDGYEVIKTILSYPDLADMNIAVLTILSQDELRDRGGLPAGVVYFGKPINFDELRGYLRACCVPKARRSA